MAKKFLRETTSKNVLSRAPHDIKNIGPLTGPYLKGTSYILPIWTFGACRTILVPIKQER